MLAVQIVSVAVAGIIGGFLSYSGKAIWRPIVGVIVGLPVGFLCGAAVGWPPANPNDPRIFLTSLLFALFGSVGGAIYGWRKRKQNEQRGKE